MPPKTKPPGEAKPSKAPRAPKTYSPAVQAMLDEKLAEINQAKGQMKEVKALEKLLPAIASLSKFGLEQASKAVVSRDEALSAATT